MIITVNGEPERVAAGSVGSYIRGRGLAAEGLVVEHNRVVLAPKAWETTMLQDGDRLEMLSFVGGG